MKIFLAAFFAVACFWLYSQNLFLTTQLTLAQKTIADMRATNAMMLEEMNQVVIEEQRKAEGRKEAYAPVRKRVQEAPASDDAPVSAILREAIAGIPE